MEPRVLGQFYEREFEDFKQNRVYPPRYRKESTVMAMTTEHPEHQRFSGAVNQFDYYSLSTKNEPTSTIIEELCKYFELYLFELRHCRMYPPRYRKEPAMRKLTIDHVSSISRAEGYMHPALIGNMSPFHRKAIEDDLERLAEVKKFLLDEIYSPGLPPKTETPDDPKPHGDTNKNNSNCS